jgi:hypothetical protein
MMNDSEAWKSNSLVELAARIKVEYEAVAPIMRQALLHVMAAGDLLLEAKSRLKHGEWTPWLLEHCDIPERTVNRYMRLAKNRAVVEAEMEKCADLSVNAAIRLLAPEKSFEDIREAAADRIEMLSLEIRAGILTTRQRLREWRAEFDTEEEFQAALAEAFPEPSDPKLARFGDLMGKLALQVAGVPYTDDENEFADFEELCDYAAQHYADEEKPTEPTE